MSTENAIMITLRNEQNGTYPCILLRKFFCMVFIDAKGKKLSLYTATVFGGLTADIDSLTKDTYVHYEAQKCKLRFEICDKESEIIKSIKISDLTSSFCKQTTHIEKVWGDCKECNEIDAKDKLKDLYPAAYETKNPIIEAGGIYYFSQKGNGLTHEFIAVPGEFEKEERAANKGVYSLTGPRDKQRTDGVEAMNWILTEIELADSVLEKRLQIIINFIDNQNAQLHALTPDFTWYFAPPPSYVIGEQSEIKIGSEAKPNLIQGVSDTTTVRFKEWVDPPNSILERKKSRFLYKSVDSETAQKLSKTQSLIANLFITNPHAPANRQFLLGLLVAFLLSFCADKTRINEFYDCIHAYCTCGDQCICKTACNVISLFAPLLLVITFLSLIMAPKRCIPEEPQNIWKKILKISRFFGIILALVVTIYTFVAWPIFPNKMSLFFSCNVNLWILRVGYILPIVINGIYLGICVFKYKRQMYNYL